MDENTLTMDTKCPLCNMEFCSVSSRNKHIRNIHHQQIPDAPSRTSRIVCPVCEGNEFICGTYERLQTHLDVSHNIKLEAETFSFSSKEAYDQWFGEHRIEVNYAVGRTRKTVDYLAKVYFCNRSDTQRRESSKTGRARTQKFGGSIKIHGVCPSRLDVKLYYAGQVIVKFIKSHVGHDEEIRSQHLSNAEKAMIVEKLVSGVTVERIISDARKVTDDKLERINMINRKDIAHLMNKNNIMKRSLYEQRKGSDSVSGDLSDLLGECSSNIKTGHNDEIQTFIEAKKNENQESEPLMDKRAMREVGIESVSNFLRSVNDETYERFMKQFTTMMEQESRTNTSKRKMNRQDFFPTKKKK